ncbi:hypothetical protein Vadar_010977 [Vaccinium darrowii]|uniref:Uncharacterized protein n=1 Tax=Vaccinium darrowii TaxID=229202 RepID=A0ACB7YUQ0_9ERIC|nr:hypothetical protein Vadar_010977 [Vaccinium darrowii]
MSLLRIALNYEAILYSCMLCMGRVVMIEWGEFRKSTIVQHPILENWNVPNSSCNEAMLARQGWRLLMNKEAYWARFFKGIYFPNTSFLNASRGGRASWAWLSLLHGRNLLFKGLQWQRSSFGGSRGPPRNILTSAYETTFTPPGFLNPTADDVIHVI